MLIRKDIPDGFFTSVDLARHANLSLRQVQWYDERRVLRPAMFKGHRRLYSTAQLDLARKIGQLRRAGVSLQAIRKMKLDKMAFVRVVSVKRKPVLIGDVLVTA